MNPLLAAAMIAAALPQVHFSQATAASTGTDVIATGRDSANRLTVPVTLGTHGPFDFLIDTGSENTAVSKTLATRLSLIPTAMATVIGVAGLQKVPVIELERVGLGQRTYFGLTAPVLDRANLRADGILGLDGLRGQRVLIDFRNNRMAVNDARSLGGDSGFEIVVTARRRNGQLIMTDARIDGIRVDVVIDTGSDTTLGNRALQKAMGRRGQPAGQVILHSVTGQELVADMSFAGRLEIQGVRITGPNIAYSDSPTFAHLKLDTKPAILLGMREMRVFPRIAIDFSNRTVLFDLPEQNDPAYFDPDLPQAEAPSAP